ncbi:protein-methionine-sulfoxide reductase catalytic subunit MsrP [Octadecabacter sp. G9-8]|uniref:Protein-methionine-sulfoxide reductase catalytic subunit MsrP n=1 Tax=Octadecabacter dasysiphoniae TaxID=2909341 RepID=A0ABS9CVR2_9RHOB|nr:protein-methionine-sulfoxide reductase catalytic subunit MsrP [Octadecabacter dasysiphoniae]MCF2871243.1 protein-methionine-sulfoxide reductase catalytic subunit MsrP [Octadecabacter dasysiphoniae]
MAHRWKNTFTHADVTPEPLWLNRRAILAGMAGAGALGGVGSVAAQEALEPNTWEQITTYNNFYEFGTGKSDPSDNAGDMVTDPWEITIDGMVDNPGTFSLAELVDGMTMEERLYRFRCVEAWAMVVPWNGFELADLLNRAGIQDGATHVAFETAVLPDVMPGVRRNVIEFPYVEGLRLDEAVHPLTIMATGIYDRPLANQSGAPIRLVVPWKYGFKSIKSIVKITVTNEQPPTTWNKINAREYGFYSNVNPQVDHPRWSQASHRVIGGGLFNSREDTLMFNGYPEVASLYEGMDLRENY